MCDDDRHFLVRLFPFVPKDQHRLTDDARHRSKADGLYVCMELSIPAVNMFGHVVQDFSNFCFSTVAFFGHFCFFNTNQTTVARRPNWPVQAPGAYKKYTNKH